MSASEARVNANRLNSLKSSGPRTIEGKERSRRNGLKHGMTGDGVVLAAQEASEVDLRNAALLKEMAPRSPRGVLLVREMALHSIRMERGAKQACSSLRTRVRHAGDDFDEERLERAEQLLIDLRCDPRGNCRKLRKMPEGVAMMAQTWRDLREELTRDFRPSWDAKHVLAASCLLGLVEEDSRGTRFGVLSRVLWGDFAGLSEEDGITLEGDERRFWVRDRLVERIDEELAELEAHYETLDFAMIEQDRAEAEATALFDPSRQASLARRYESEARRGYYKAQKEFREVEAELEARSHLAPPIATPAPIQPPPPLALSCDPPEAALDESDQADPERAPEPSLAVEADDSRELTVRRDANGRFSRLGGPLPGAA